MRLKHARSRRWTLALAGAAVFCITLWTAGCTSEKPAPQAASTAKDPASGYENLIVRMPGNNPEEGKVYVVRGGRKQWVVRASWFAQNGYRFPDDVRVIPASDLNAIPTGDPIE